MDHDDLEPRRDQPPLKNLAPMSVAELTAYIGELEAEINRTRAAIAAKENVRAGAESLFKR